MSTIDGTVPYVDTAAVRAAGYTGLVDVKVPAHLLDLLTEEIAQDAETFRLAGDLDAALKAAEVQCELLSQSSKIRAKELAKAQKAKLAKTVDKVPVKKTTRVKKSAQTPVDTENADSPDRDLSIA
jgi:hypothetical protein